MTPSAPGGGARGTSSEHLRRHNLSVILGIIHRNSGMSRSQLTQRLGLNRSTVGALVSELVDSDLAVEDRAPGTNRVGRPSPVIRPSTTPVAVALNPEIDALTLGIVGLGGRVVKMIRRPFATVPSAEEGVRTARQMLDELRIELAAHRIVGIAVAVPGLVRESDGLVRLAPHLRWIDEPFAALLQEATGLPVAAANDARLGARAEGAFGAGRGVKDVVYVNGGASGIGSGIIAGGVPVGGDGGYAGELGHTMVNPRGVVCHCGAVGCLETEVRRDRLLEVTGLTADTVDQLAVALATDLDPAVRAEVRRQLDFLAIALRNAVNVLNPRLVLLGGFLAALHGADPSRLGSFGALAASAENVSIRPAELGPHLLLIGAAELAFEAILADPASF